MVKILKKGCITDSRDSIFGYCAWPSVCVDEKGMIYVVCSGNRMNHMCPFGKILLYRSIDNGESWSVPSVIFDSCLDDRDPCVLYLGDGKIFFGACRHPAQVYENEFTQWLTEDSGDAGLGVVKRYSQLSAEERRGGSFGRISRDYGFSLCDEFEIPVHTPHGPIKLSDGSLLYLGKEKRKDRLDMERVITAFKSWDGVTFERVGQVPLPEGMRWDLFHEPHCVELDDGRIWGVIRTHPPVGIDHSFSIYSTFSNDCGKTWSVPSATGVCGSPPHCLKLPDGRIALTYARRIEPFGIFLRIADRDGNIPDEEIMLDDAFGDDIGYPASVLLTDGSILTVYYKRTTESQGCKILYTKWRIE